MLSHMAVFNKYMKDPIIETLAQMIEKFNDASGGTIRLTTDGFDGDFLQRSFWAAIHSSRRRVDRYASNTTASATDLSQLQQNGVKVAGGFGPIRYEPSQLTWLEKPTAEAVEVVSRNFAEALLQDQLNTAVLCLVAAIRGNPGCVYDVSLSSGGTAITYGAINGSHAKFGDHSSSLIADVMTGATMHRLIGQNLANAEQLFVASGVRVIDILGKLVVVTDAPALTEVAGSPVPTEMVLSLTDGAAVVYDGSDVITNIETNNGNLRIETTIQSDYSFGVALKGYSWDTGNGGKSPTDAELATSSNWDQIATNDKHTAGTIVIGNLLAA